MAQYTPAFARVIELSLTPEWSNKVWKTGGKAYDRRGDFREISGGELPVILHQGNRFNRKAGDKVELIETGGLKLLEMVSTVQNLYQIDAQEQRILRLDLAADNEDVTVEWFRTHTYARFKQTQREWKVESISQRRAESVTAGMKPNQLRTYDKTAHRKVLLGKERRKMLKEDRGLCMTFEERWGYSPDKTVTRVERQIGGEQIAKVGYTKVGNLYELQTCDPFKQIIFPGEGHSLDIYAGRFSEFENALMHLRPEHRITAKYLRDYALSEGIKHTQNHLRRMCKTPTEFYRLWKRYQPFVMPVDTSNGTTRERLQLAFRASITKQLTYAA